MASTRAESVRDAGRRLWRRGGRRVQRAVAQRRGLVAYLAVIGPGIIAANAGNDAGGIATYASAGADYGYNLLWTLVPLALALGVVQETCARMGAVTGKGLSDLIRERFGVRWTVLVMLALLVANGGVTVSEFVGIAAATELFGVPRFVSVPAAAFAVWWLVVKGSYRRVERVFLVMSLVFLGYVVSAFLARPDWGEVARGFARPQLDFGAGYLFTVVALIGTTISPYMQVFVQSSVVEKGVDEEDYALTRADVWAGTVFAIAAAVLPLSTAYSISEALGFEKGVSRTFREAPIFVGIFTFLIAVGGVVAMIPGLPLFDVLLVTQVINGLLLPVLLVSVLRLASDRELMGAHANGRVYNAASWLTVLVVSALSLLFIATRIFNFG